MCIQVFVGLGSQPTKQAHYLNKKEKMKEAQMVVEHTGGSGLSMFSASNNTVLCSLQPRQIQNNGVLRLLDASATNIK